MGRELRMVPANWEHPKVDRWNGELGYQPMYDSTFEQAAKEWKDGFAAWERGDRPSYCSDECKSLEYWEYEMDPPNRKYYRPWKDEEATWYQVWETVSEGTPVTPPFETKEELIEYLVANGDFWDQDRRARGDSFMNCDPWSRQAAETFVNGPGWAPSFICDNKGFRSGVETLGDPGAE
jgi:hypothetical protein